jgi:hypothetical protein
VENGVQVTLVLGTWVTVDGEEECLAVEGIVTRDGTRTIYRCIYMKREDAVAELRPALRDQLEDPDTSGSRGTWLGRS